MTRIVDGWGQRVAIAGLAAVGATGLAATPVAADRYRDGQWHLEYLDVATAHELSTGEGITVAVLDTGVSGDHPDLEGNVLPGVDVVAGGQGDGWGDPDGHGTGMAGLVAAHGHGPGGAEGVLGIAPAAKILPIRMAGADGRLTGGDGMALAVEAAVDRGAKVICISVGTDTRAYDAIVGAVEDHGLIVVSAAGNRPEDEMVADSATWPGVVGVGAVGPDGLVADVSARGGPMMRLTLTAPGVDIVSTSKEGRYRIGTGTSDSAAIVTGAAALVWSRYPQLTNTQVVDHLIATATDKGAPGHDDEYGHGDLDLVKALETEPTPTTTTTFPEGNGLPPRVNPPTTPAADGAEQADAVADRDDADAADDDGGGSPALGIAIVALVLAGVGALAAVVRRGRLG